MTSEQPTTDIDRAERARVRVLLTGFGPFPGVPHNVSSQLARDAACAWHARGPDATDVRVAATALPTVWGRASELFDEAIAGFRPHAVISFGVSQVARSFVVETLARNVARHADAMARQPVDGRLNASAPRLRASRFGARPLVRHLRREGIPAVVSRDAGAYLCNALLFDALGRLATRPTDGDGARVPSATNASDGLAAAAFIHMPVTLACPRTPRSPGDVRLTWPDALRGAQEIISFIARQHPAP